jgi:hypothetical protein
MRALALILAFVTILVPGIVHGLWTGRWTRSEQLENFTARLANIPANVQAWHGEDVPLDPRELARAELTGCSARRYVHQPSGRQLLVVVSCGRPGPVSLHTPDFCFPATGFTITGSQGSRAFNAPDGSTAHFNAATFVKTKPTGTEFLQVYWAWNANSGWQAPAQPRLTFGGRPALYKLYVICPFAADGQKQEVEEICRSFLQVFLPELQKSLF